MMSLKHYTLLLFIAVSLVCKSQTFEKDMELVYKNFINSSKISYNINYILKESHNANSRVISQNTGRYVKHKDTYISQYDSKSTLVMPAEIIVIDKEDKYIRIKKQEKKERKEPDFLGQLKEYNKAIDKITKLTTNKKDIITYNVELKNVPFYGISRYEISINTKTFYMEQIVLFYKKALEKDEDNQIKGNEVPRLEIIFSDFNKNRSYNELELNASYYYIRENKKLSPSVNFKGYNVKEIF